MMDFTGIARRIMADRVRQAENWRGEGIRIAQMRLLEKLTEQGEKTLYGNARDALRRGTNIERTSSHERFCNALPVCEYPEIRKLVMRMVNGKKNILWPGRCVRFAQSSGTSDGQSKFIPVTGDSLKHNHYAGASHAVAHYLMQTPESRMFAGKGFILGGSFANKLELRAGVKVGDLSANLIDDINPLVNIVRVPSKKIALMEDWTKKLPALVKASLHKNITNISGVPSWFLTVLKQVMDTAGARNIHQVWPNLEVFFHGGISMEPYRESYRELMDPEKPMHYRETYNASEGFFAVQDTVTPEGMLLLLDAGIFYEFIPMDGSRRQQGSFPEALTAWQVEKGKIYELVITAMNGLWRYRIGDTVRVESTDPLRITISGRTKHYINAFGEEVMVYNTDRALAKTCSRTGATVLNYTVAPIFSEGKNHGRHQWLIEWGNKPADIEAFAKLLDEALQMENSDYEAKRQGSIFLDNLTITTARQGLFDRWLATSGKLGGQRKVPRLANDRSNMDRMLEMNSR